MIVIHNCKYIYLKSFTAVPLLVKYHSLIENGIEQIKICRFIVGESVRWICIYISNLDDISLIEQIEN